MQRPSSANPFRQTVTALAALVLSAVAQSVAQTPLPQNPSPMTDLTRPHPRVPEVAPPGRRASVGGSTLFIRDGLRETARLPIIVHFHGAPWLVEHHVARRRIDAVLVTTQLGSGSGVYGTAFAEPSRFATLVADSTREASRILGRTVEFDRVVLTSFSAGYGAVRAILRDAGSYARVSAVVLADSLHASYRGDAAAPRTRDLDVVDTDLDAFRRLAADAVGGRKRFLVTHSEVFPGTYASTTETADALLRSVGLTRRPRLREGPLGMQMLSDSGRGGFRVLGFAGNTAPDHMDHLYALGEWFEEVGADR